MFNTAISPNSELQQRIELKLKQNTNFSGEKRLKFAQALVHLTYKEKAIITPQMVQNGFKTIGMISDYDLTDQKVEKRLEQTLSRCPAVQTQISSEDLTRIKENFPKMVEQFEINGQITEEQFDSWGIVKNEKNTRLDKDQKVLHQQRLYC